MCIFIPFRLVSYLPSVSSSALLSLFHLLSPAHLPDIGSHLHGQDCGETPVDGREGRWGRVEEVETKGKGEQGEVYIT